MTRKDADPWRWFDRLLGLCFAVLLGAMALYGAVRLVAAVWLPLCIGAAVLVGLGAAGWVVASRWRRW